MHSLSSCFLEIICKTLLTSLDINCRLWTVLSEVGICIGSLLNHCTIGVLGDSEGHPINKFINCIS